MLSIDIMLHFELDWALAGIGMYGGARGCTYATDHRDVHVCHCEAQTWPIWHVHVSPIPYATMPVTRPHLDNTYSFQPLTAYTAVFTLAYGLPLTCALNLSLRIESFFPCAGLCAKGTGRQEVLNSIYTFHFVRTVPDLDALYFPSQ